MGEISEVFYHADRVTNIKSVRKELCGATASGTGDIICEMACDRKCAWYRQYKKLLAERNLTDAEVQMALKHRPKNTKHQVSSPEKLARDRAYYQANR